MVNNRKAVWYLVLLIVLIVPASPAVESAAQVEIARVRFVNVSPGAPTLNAYVDGRLWAGVSPEETVNYQDVVAGKHTFSFRLRDASQDVASVAGTVRDAQRITVAAMDGPQGVVARLYRDDVSAPARNAARITVIHAVPDAPPITVQIDSITVAENLRYGAASRSARQFYDGTHDISLAVGGMAQPLSGAVRTFTGNRTYTLFVVGSAATDEYQIVAAESTVLRPDGSSRFRFANMARGVGDVTVYINQEDLAIFPQVRFSRVTQYYVTGPGPHTMEVYPLGSPREGTPLARGTAEIGPDEHVLFVMQGTADDLAVQAYTSDLSPVAAGSGRLQVINVAVDNPAFEVETLDGVPLFDSLEVGDSASREMPVGGYGIRFKNAESGEMMMEQGGVQVRRGVITLLIAADDDPGAPLINAIPVTVEGVPQYAAIRWAHLAVGSGPVDVYLDDTPVIRGLAYRLMIDYRLYRPETVSMRVVPAGSDPATTPPLIETRISLGRVAEPRTIYFYGAADGIGLGYEAALDNAAFLPAGSGRIRFINAAQDTGNLSVVQAATNAVLVDNLLPGTSSVHKHLLAGSRTYEFVGAGGAVIATLDDLNVESGVVYTVVLIGDAAQPGGVEVLVWQHVP
jgi:hypothetical protein